ncbi:6110_t:CDS:2, partial [Racocetra persica]
SSISLRKEAVEVLDWGVLEGLDFFLLGGEFGSFSGHEFGKLDLLTMNTN